MKKQDDFLAILLKGYRFRFPLFEINAPLSYAANMWFGSKPEKRIISIS
jgi:hypothetical protein